MIIKYLHLKPQGMQIPKMFCVDAPSATYLFVRRRCCVPQFIAVGINTHTKKARRVNGQSVNGQSVNTLVVVSCKQREELYVNS